MERRVVLKGKLVLLMLMVVTSMKYSSEAVPRLEIEAVMTGLTRRGM